MPEFDSPGPEELSADLAWWRIYEDSFPPSEREPAGVILDSVRRGVGLAIRARFQDSTIGLATTHLLRQPPAVFLVYLAIDRAHRDRGLGGALLDHACRASAAWPSSSVAALRSSPNPTSSRPWMALHPSPCS